MQTILYTHDAASALRAIIDTLPGTDRVVWLADAHTCHIAEELKLQCTVASHTIVVGAGDDHKNIETLVNVWQELQQAGATRHSLLINVGGGMVTDLGGFAAATFKRGIRFVNVPTTLLAMIDASVGGKTGINFGGYKNEIGAFKEADYVVVCTEFCGRSTNRIFARDMPKCSSMRCSKTSRCSCSICSLTSHRPTMLRCSRW